MRLSFLGLATIALLGLACAQGSDEQKIRGTISAMQAAVEAREPREFMRHVDTDFVGNEAETDREAVHNLLRVQMLRNEKIHVAVGPIDVELQGGRATTKLTATLAGGSGGWIPERGAVYSVSMGWKKSAGDWTLISAMWERTL